jgi:hypothetical protein
MHDFNRAFQEGEQQGRQQTREAINAVREGRDVPFEYLKKIASRLLFVSFLIGVGAFTYFHFNHVNILLSIVWGIGTYVVSVIVLSLLFVFLLKVAGKKRT